MTILPALPNKMQHLTARRNEAVNGGAIVNSALISFVADEKLFTADNVATGEVRRESTSINPRQHEDASEYE